MKRTHPVERVRSRIAELQERNLLRNPLVPARSNSFCSNDYLGLARSESAQAVAGAGASRLVSGQHGLHLDLEREIVSWLGVPAALVFSSGYAANLGALQALIEPGDFVVSDALNHASIIDGLRLARADVRVVPHRDLAALRAALANAGDRCAWVVTESYFSMDADTPDLPALRALCNEFNAGLFVDEAHALGVFGPDGRGLCADAGITPDVLVGTLGKAFGASGAFVAASREITHWLWNRARSFVFSTGISPAVAATAQRNIKIAISDSSLRTRLHKNASAFRDALQSLGIRPIGYGPIIPWVLGDATRAVAMAARLSDYGIHAQAIRPPTVPQGSSRIRFAVSAAHTEYDLARAVRALSEIVRVDAARSAEVQWAGSSL